MTAAALLVASLALLFTVASFWWLHARTGKLVAFEPRTFAAYVRPDAQRSGLRFQLVLHNTGAVPIVVLELRLRFASASEPPMMWEWTRPTVDPTSGDVKDAAAPFSVPGRGVRELVTEFRGDFPGKVPEPHAYSVTVEAKASSSPETWTPVLSFDFNAGNLVEPGVYITYSNDPEYLTDAERQKAAKALADMRAKIRVADAH